MPLAIPMW